MATSPRPGTFPTRVWARAAAASSHVLTVVEDNNERAPGEVSSDEFCRRSRRLGVAQSEPQGSECSGRGRGDPLGIGAPASSISQAPPGCCSRQRAATSTAKRVLPLHQVRSA